MGDERPVSFPRTDSFPVRFYFIDVTRLGRLISPFVALLATGNDINTLDDLIKIAVTMKDD